MANEQIHPQKTDKRDNLRLVAWEITRNCNLSCVHCRASATMGSYSGELDTDSAFFAIRPDRIGGISHCHFDRW